ncbi:hypothetical protein PHISCL_08149 [Aspergillus sclerotialis]|uniref:Uncharacterized protein n=1 Tax=Aspergillus sclerotialis TaxID=2070753 RepID=A0A3A2ZDV3_9EURO|nr:hypothetical protein PHISCL_08149 [Aspergillus sclerotialis]
MDALTTTITTPPATTLEDPLPPDYYSAANIFLQKEVYRLGVERGLRSRPPGRERDFLTQTWGPIVYCTTYAPPDSERLILHFLDALNNEIVNSISRTLPGSKEQERMIQRTYASKAFYDKALFDSLNEDAIRDSFHDWKVFLEIPTIELPTRLRICLLIDDSILARFREKVDLAMAVVKDADLSTCPIKVVEENFPDQINRDSVVNKSYSYPGWTSVVLRSLLEVFNGLSSGCRLEQYHRQGRTYLGNGEWS